MRLFDKIGEIPTKLQVQVGALVANIADRKLFTKTPAGDIISFGGVSSGSDTKGSWTKLGDGTILQWGEGILVKKGTYTHIATLSSAYPVHFVGDFPTVSFFLTTPPADAVARNNHIEIAYDSYTKAEISYLSDSTIDLSSLWGLKVRWMAIGRYK